MRAVSTILAASLVAGCATDVNRTNARRYYDVGLRAEAARAWPVAREAYRRSLIDTNSAGGPAVMASAATYNLGRMTAYTCDYAQAEVLLRESLTLEQGLAQPDAGNVTKRWSELARLLQDEGRDAEAAAFYAQAVPELERLGSATSDPIGFSDYLDEYARALTNAGQAARATTVSAQAAALRAAHPAQVAKFVPLRFNTVCGAPK